MPTIMRFEGLRVVVYPNDHRPAHVHVVGSDREAVFDLHCPHGPPRLRENFRFTLAGLKRVEEMLKEHLTALCEAWSKIHGA